MTVTSAGVAPDATAAPVVVDTSPLIVLAKIGRMDILAVEGRAVLITETVFQEVMAGKPSDPARQALMGVSGTPSGGWGQRTPDVPALSALAAWGLDAGEQATLALAQKIGLVAVLDDGDGRRAARALGIRHTGTVGVVIAGKRRGLLRSAADTLRALRSVGLYLPHDARLRGELATVGEEWP